MAEHPESKAQAPKAGNKDFAWMHTVLLLATLSTAAYALRSSRAAFVLGAPLVPLVGATVLRLTFMRGGPQRPCWAIKSDLSWCGNSRVTGRRAFCSSHPWSRYSVRFAGAGVAVTTAMFTIWTLFLDDSEARARKDRARLSLKIGALGNEIATAKQTKKELEAALRKLQEEKRDRLVLAGMASAQRADWLGALKHMDEAIQLGARGSRVAAERGRALAALGRYSDARPAFENAIESADTNEELALAYALHGFSALPYDPIGSLAKIRRGLRSGKSSLPPGDLHFAEACITPSWTACVERLQQALDADPRHWPALEALVLCRIADGRPRDALRLAEQLAPYYRGSAVVLAYRYIALSQLGAPEAAPLLERIRERESVLAALLDLTGEMLRTVSGSVDSKAKLIAAEILDIRAPGSGSDPSSVRDTTNRILQRIRDIIEAMGRGKGGEVRIHIPLAFRQRYGPAVLLGGRLLRPNPDLHVLGRELARSIPELLGRTGLVWFAFLQQEASTETLLDLFGRLDDAIDDGGVSGGISSVRRFHLMVEWRIVGVALQRGLVTESKLDGRIKSLVERTCRAVGTSDLEWAATLKVVDMLQSDAANEFRIQLLASWVSTCGATERWKNYKWPVAADAVAPQVSEER